LAWTRQVSRSRLTTSGLRTPWTSSPSGSAGSRSVTGRGASSSATSGTSGRSCGPPAAGRTGPRLTIPLVLGRTPCRLPRSSRWQATRLLADAQNICSGASLERKSGTLRKHRTAAQCAFSLTSPSLSVMPLWTWPVRRDCCSRGRGGRDARRCRQANGAGRGARSRLARHALCSMCGCREPIGVAACSADVSLAVCGWPPVC